MMEMTISDVDFNVLWGGIVKAKDALIKGNSAEAAYLLGMLHQYTGTLRKDNPPSLPPESVTCGLVMSMIEAVEAELAGLADHLDAPPSYGDSRFMEGYRCGCRKAVSLMEEKAFSEKSIGSAEQTPAPPGTFEWVLARIRMGASPEAFRRRSWNDDLHLEIEDRWMSVYAGQYPRKGVSGRDITATEWEEIPPKEECE